MEKIVWRGEPTVLAFFEFLISGVVVGIASVVILAAFPGAPFGWIPTLGLGAAVLIVNFAFSNVWATIYIISEFGICRECRFIVFEVNEIPFDKIKAVVVSQGAVGRIFRFGTVRIVSASISFKDILLRGVREPEEVRGIILEYREKALAN